MQEKKLRTVEDTYAWKIKVKKVDTYILYQWGLAN